MPRTPLRAAAGALALAALALPACAGEPPATARPVAPRRADPPRSPAGERGEPGSSPAVEVTLAIPVGTSPDGVALEVVIRSVEAGGRRRVAIDTPAGTVDQHVVTEDEHWWWIPPLAREAVGAVEWIHLDVDEVEAAGAELPDAVVDARVPLPAPGTIRPGTRVAGYEVVAVESVGAREDRITLAGLDEPARLRLRHLPASTVVEPPIGAVELTDLPDAVHAGIASR